MIINCLQSFPKRYYVIILLFLSDVFKSYLMGSPNLIIAQLSTDRKVVDGNGTQTIPAKLDWSSKERGFALGAHALGHVFSVFGGMMVHKVGGATFIAIGLLGAGITVMLEPLMINLHVYLFTISRLLYGFFEGFTLTANIDVVARWIPQHERVRALTVLSLGYSFGHAINFPLTGFILENLSWSAVFYISGVVILIWCFIWITFVSNDPSTDRFISRDEKEYLSDKISYISKDKNCKIPYRDIFTSVPTYALLNEFFVCSIIFSFSKMLPFFVQDLYDANIQIIGLISGIPECASLIIQPIFAYFADHMRSNGFNIGRLHKSFLFWGQSSTLVFFFLATLGNNIIGCVVCITLAKISFSLSQVSYGAIVIDTAGHYAGFVQSLTVVVRSIGAFLNPIIIGWLIQSHSRSEWNTYFLFIGFLTMYGVIIFLIFGSGDLQPWATESPQETIKNEDVRL